MKLLFFGAIVVNILNNLCFNIIVYIRNIPSRNNQWTKLTNIVLVQRKEEISGIIQF